MTSHICIAVEQLIAPSDRPLEAFMVLKMENESYLLQSLRRIIESYVADAEKKEELLSEVVRPKVKYVLAELEKHRSHEITELFFHFC